VFRHDKALEGITVCGEMRGQDRFTHVIQGLSMDDPQLKVRSSPAGHCLYKIVHFMCRKYLFTG